MKKTLTRLLSLVLVLTMFLSTAPLALATNGDDTTIKATSIAFNYSGRIAVPDSRNIEAAIEPAGATDVTWESSNPAVATVDQSGNVTAVKAGTVTITAKGSTPGVSDSVDITIIYKVAASSTMTMTVGDKKDVAVTIPGLPSSHYTLEYVPTDTTVVKVTGGKLEAVKAGSTTVKVTVKPGASSGVTADDIKGATFDVDVTVKAADPTSYTVSIDPTMTIKVGQEVNLPTIKGLDQANKDSYTVTWSENDTPISINDAKTKVKGEAVGQADLKLTVAPVTGSNITINGSPLTCVVTVEANPSLANDDKQLTVPYGSTIDPPALQGMTGLTDYTVTWQSSRPSIVDVETINNNTKTVFSGKGNGSAVLTGTVKSGTKVLGTVECTVTVVSNLALQVADQEIEIALSGNDSYTVKRPTLVGDDAVYATLTEWKYVKVDSDNTKYTEETYKLTDTTGNKITPQKTGRDTYRVTAKAEIKKNGTTTVVDVLPTEVIVSVYADMGDITVVLKDSVDSFTFDEKNVMTSLKLEGSGVQSHESLEALLVDLWNDHTEDRAPDASNYDLFFDNWNGAGGELSQATSAFEGRTWFTMAGLQHVKFTKSSGSATKSRFSYEVRDEYDMLVMTGAIVIDYKDTAEIEYTTDGEAVTFDENDFEKFWTTYANTTYTLDYVVFPTKPATTDGKLYTTTGMSTQVGTTDRFEPNHTGSANYDLDTVTFKPAANADGTILIPFTAYGKSNSGKVSGNVAIIIGDSDLTITKLGFRFGQSTAELDEAIADKFYDEEGETLDYVTFTIPSKEVGQMFYDYNTSTDTLLDAEWISKSTRLYYDATGSEYDLADVHFFPSECCPESVTLKYTAHGVNGATYEGTVSLTVITQTSSSKFKDVKGGTGWAADSVDFLEYHSVVNGITSNTFGPSNKITRGDFMLMLYRAFLKDEYEDTTISSNFADVTKGTSDYSKELYQAIGVAKKLGIATGDGTNYYPKKNISREEAMTLIYRTLDELNIGLTVTSTKDTRDFTDYSKVSTYAKDPIEYLIEHDIVRGDAGKINPKNNITRAEMAVILHRVLTF